ncbi:MAG: hypothetical protein J6M42_05575 [Clostridia bacterium]|nr:hypothetical protein [Clostridia bacterium]
MYQEYVAFLNHKLTVAVVMCIISLIISLIALFLSFVWRTKKADKTIASFFVVIILTISIFYISPYEKDMDEKSFMEYSGEVYIDKVYAGRGTPMRAVISFPDGSKKQFNVYETIELTEGKYTARLLYSEHTHYLFEFDILSEIE